MADGLAVDIIGHVRSFLSRDPQPRFGHETGVTRAAARIRSKLSRPAARSGVMMMGTIALITAILAMLGGEQFSPHAIFVYLAATIMIGMKFGSLLALANAWLSAAIGGIVLYEPVFTLTIDNPISLRSLLAFVGAATAVSIAFYRVRGNATA